MANNKNVYQFKITLDGIEPKIWRRIQVPEEYSFWDFHVAIQDAMGWTDSHLHQFIIVIPECGEISYIGIPDEEEENNFMPNFKAGWEKFIRDYFFVKKFDNCKYEYDFGNGWLHKIELEKILPAIPECKYPICIDGERACPPEDCGGVGGYADFLEIINNSKREEHNNKLIWGGNFDPEKFDPQEIHFDDPKERWNRTFEF